MKVLLPAAINIYVLKQANQSQVLTPAKRKLVSKITYTQMYVILYSKDKSDILLKSFIVLILHL